MGEPQLENKYSYADYLTWDDNERWELIDGIPYAMSPAPTWKHQDIEGNLFLEFGNFLKGKKCKVFNSPFDVRFIDKKKDNSDIINVVQPDILVLCDTSKLDGTGCIGAPDLVVEVLSESTAKYDMGIKKLLYEKHGVKEYWIVDPCTKSIDVYLLKNKKYGFPKVYEAEMDIPVSSLKGLTINVQDIFDI